MANSAPAHVPRWDVFELTLTGPGNGNPFIELDFAAEFSFEHRRMRVRGFYDGDGVYRARFMPDTEGRWTFRTVSNAAELSGISGEFLCTAPDSGNHGVVRAADIYHFSYDDGTPYSPFGTTCYAWTHQGDAMEEQTLATLGESPFNKVRMCVFPKWYVYNRGEPPRYPYAGSPEAGWDFTRFDPGFFRHLDQRVRDLLALGIQSDVILFHPYDKWGFAEMSAEDDRRYLQYVISRLSAYRNVWWSLANEYDLFRSKSVNEWDALFRQVQETDPYGHLRSIHNAGRFYDHAKPWVTHCSIQSGVEHVNEWRALYRKPVVVDECAYEGNIQHNWGNISGEELVRRFWEGVVRGGYVSHGETYLRPDDRLWWSKGGELVGTSPARIAFLRQVLEDSVMKARASVGSPQLAYGLAPIRCSWDWLCGGIEDLVYLFYFGYRRPAFKEIDLPGEGRYSVEIIDTWDMTITTREETVQGRFRVDLPEKPYMAVRLERRT